MTDAWDGRPENPERDGWHWLYRPEDLRPMVQPWNAKLGGWISGALHSPRGVVDFGFRYLGPALLPVVVEAREAAAAEAMRQSAEDRATRDGAYATSAHIRALPLPAADALARALDQARAEEREACVEAIEKRAGEIGRQECCGYGQSDGYGPPECCGDPDLMISDRQAIRAIRARGKEAGGE